MNRGSLQHIFLQRGIPRMVGQATDMCVGGNNINYTWIAFELLSTLELGSCFFQPVLFIYIYIVCMY